jgi:hypothetical protein
MGVIVGLMTSSQVKGHSHVRGSLEIHGDASVSLRTLPVKSYLRLTAKNGDMTW